MGVDANKNIHGIFYVKLSTKRHYDGDELYEWLLQRIGNGLAEQIFDFSQDTNS
jgi:hypothetical protein